MVTVAVTFSVDRKSPLLLQKAMQDTHPLKVYRDAHTPKLSQAALAEKLGVARLTVLRWEAGQRKIEPARLPSVSEKTGIPAKALRPDLIEEHEKLFGESAQ